MLSIALRIVAALLFLLAGVNQTLLNQPPADLIAFGLLAWVLATLFGSAVITRAGVVQE
jgi:hypothetical protein